MAITSMAFGDVEAEFLDELDGVEGHQAVVLFLAVGQGGVGEEVGVVLEGVVALVPVGPPFGNAGGGPYVVGVLGDGFAQFHEVVGEGDVLQVDGLRVIVLDGLQDADHVAL